MSSNNGPVRTRVGKYEFGRVLGEGSFAKVRLAKNVETGQNLAIKVLNKERILKDKMVEQIKREISTMKLVKHPNIVQLSEVMASKTKIYFVLEYVTGGELFSKIAQHGKLKEDDARKYFQQLINAVDYCHSRGVYHRDLKPENLLLDAKGNLKISDFGLSALSQQVKEDGLLHTTCGTPNYVAPEVIVDKGYDGAKADLWSCGVILFVLMAGYLPFDEPNIMALYKKIYKADFTCPNWFSPGARKLILRILEPNPNNRITIPQILENSWFKKGYTPVKFREERDTSLDDIDAVFSDSTEHLVTEKKELKGARPSLMNAFDIISLSKGLNLSGLFEKKQGVKQEARFTSKYPATEIITKMEESAKPLGFNVKRRDYKQQTFTQPVVASFFTTKHCKGPSANQHTVLCSTPFSTAFEKSQSHVMGRFMLQSGDMGFFVTLAEMKLQGSETGRKGHLSVATEIFEVSPSLFVVEVKKAEGDTLEYNKFYKNFSTALKDIVWTSEVDLAEA